MTKTLTRLVELSENNTLYRLGRQMKRANISSLEYDGLKITLSSSELAGSSGKSTNKLKETEPSKKQSEQAQPSTTSSRSEFANITPPGYYIDEFYRVVPIPEEEQQLTAETEAEEVLNEQHETETLTH